MAGRFGELKVFSGTSHPQLTSDICSNLGIEPSKSEIFKFNNDNTFIRILNNIREQDVFIIQPMNKPVNDNIMELLIFIDAAKRASAGRVTAVIPYFGYGRTDKKDQPRVPISARLIADLITTAGADRILTMDLHAPQIQGFFNIPVDNLFATPIFARHIKKNIKLDNLICVSPDVGGVERTRALSRRLNSSIAIIDKRRPAPGKSEVMNIVGDVKNKKCVIIDDIIDSGGTIVNAAKALKDKGAKEVYVYITHAVLSGSAVDKIEKSQIKKLITTDTIDNTKKIKTMKKIQIISIAPMISEAMKRISNSTSVSSLFK
jgi:ribose-phosphate pyrophosphokinase